jgi:hypothetical protein
MIIGAAHSDNKDKHGKHLELNYEICRAMDGTKFSIALEKLVAQGMSQEMAKIFEAQFFGLLAAVRTENNRLTAWMPLK